MDRIKHNIKSMYMVGLLVFIRPLIEIYRNSLSIGIGVSIFMILLYGFIFSNAFISVKSHIDEHIISYIFLIETIMEWSLEVFIRKMGIDSFVAPWYVCDYSLGFGSRFLVGNILSMFYDDFMDARIPYYFFMATMLLIILLMFVVLYVFEKVLDSKKRKACFYLMVIYLASPASFVNYFYAANIGRLEVYTLLLTLICILIFFVEKDLKKKYIYITFFNVAALLFYQGGIFLFYPVTFFFMVLEYYKSEDSLKKNALLYGLISFAVECVAFLFVQFYSSVCFEDVWSMYYYLQGKTDMPINPSPIYYETFSPLKEAYTVFWDYFKSEWGPQCYVISCILILPQIIFFMGIICGSIKRQMKMDDKKQTLQLIFLFVINLAFFPQFILNIDWYRWTIALFLVLLIEIFVLVYKGYVVVADSIESVGIFIEKYMLVYVIVTIWLSFLERFQADTTMDQSIYIYWYILKISGGV